MSTNALSIYFFSMDLVGPQHACIGLAQALKARGHRVRFFARSEAAARFRHYGFECFDLVDNVKQSENVVKDFIASFKETGLFDDRSPLEKMKIIVASAFFKDETNQCLGYEPQIRAILAKERPDLVVVDSEVLPPSLICQKDFPWVMIFCSNPVGLFNSPDLPPFTSDLPTDPSFRPQWEAYAAELDAALYKGVRESQRRVCEQFGCPRSEPQVARVLSPHLNLYQFPAELDYDDRIQLPANCHRVDAYIRDEPTGYQLPVEFKNKMKAGDKLIYLSMGSMGSFDVSLMQKLVATLAKTPHWYIVSKGPLADQYELPENMIGEAFVPQTRILPLVDAAIMHGGNNSLTECIFYGKPMIVMPLFYDQFNNSQRVAEKQFGLTLNPYNFEPAELVAAVDRVLTDQDLGARLRRASARIQQSRSKEIACERIEEVARQFVR